LFSPYFDQGLVDKHYREELEKDTNLYGSELSQTERFRNTFKYFNFTGKVLLEVGCGKGDFLFYLLDKAQIPSQYIGLDPFEEMIKKSTTRLASLPQTKVRLICDDYLNITEEIDIITAFSVFDRKFGNFNISKLYMERMIEKMVSEARVGIYVTFLSAYKNINDFGEALFYPSEIFKFAHRLTERVIIDNSYMPHAFSLIIYKEKSNWKKAWEVGKWK